MIKLLQRDINMAIAWWMDTGVHMKMASDVREEHGSVSNYWQRPKIRGNLPLGPSHVAPSAIIYGVAMFVSIIAFIQEISNYLSKQSKIEKKREKQRQLKRARERQRQLRRERFQPNKPATSSPQKPMKAWT